LSSSTISLRTVAELTLRPWCPVRCSDATGRAVDTYSSMMIARICRCRSVMYMSFLEATCWGPSVGSSIDVYSNSCLQLAANSGFAVPGTLALRVLRALPTVYNLIRVLSRLRMDVSVQIEG